MKNTFLTFILLAIATLSRSDRMPTGMQVYQYNLHLTFTEDTFTRPPYEYEGYLQIMFSLYLSYPSDIQLYAARDFITVQSVALEVNSNLTDITVFDIDENDILTLGNTEIAKTNMYTSHLFINYSSRLSVDDMYGLYKSTYTSNGASKYMAASQFEPTFARRVFPCIDEPTFKTPFRLNVTHPPDMEVYFNSAENVTEIEDDTSVTTYFRTTGTMAPFMAGVFVSLANDFTCTIGENFTSGTIYYYRVCSRPETEYARTFALETGPSIMEKLYNVTNYGYGVIMGFQKMDMLALPNMVSSATENWGVITYREQDLLYDEDNSSNLDKQHIAEMLTFEFTQMWFGNMATAEWWNYLYLTKGLAYYFQYLITEKVFEDWDLNKQFVYRVLQPALELDSLGHSPNLRTGANTTQEIISKFGQISLLKGASIFRMLNEAIAGYKSFRQGLEYFLTSFSYRNTEPQGMWNLISAQINLDNRELFPPDTYLKDALIGWEINPGFPLLQVTREAGFVTVQQKGRFLYPRLDESYEWYVPVSYVFSSNPADFDNVTLNQYSLPNSSFEVELPSHDEEWVILNSQATGYYRVHYGDMWQNISASVHASDFSGIPELTRAQLLDDVFALARANFLNYSFVFGYLDYLAAEESLYPWMTAMNGGNYLLRRVGYTSVLGLDIDDRFLTYISKIYGTVPWSTLKEDDQVYSIKQIEILGAACRMGYTDCVKNALSQFASFKNSGNRPHKNLRSIVYCNGLLYGTDTANWEVLWNAYGTTELAAERVKILSVLGCSENEDLLQKSLALTLDDNSGIKPQDSSIIFTSVYRNSKVGAKVALTFLTSNHLSIAKRYQGMNVLGDLILGLAEHLSDSDQIEQFRQFLQNTNDLAEDFKAFTDQALEITDVNTIWLDNHLDELNEYFEISLEEDETSPTSGGTTTSTITIPTTRSAGSTSTSIPDDEELPPGRSNIFGASFALVGLSIFFTLVN